MPAPLSFRLAAEDDVPAIVHMLADDALGATRENTGAEALPNYMQAFKKIAGDPNQELTIATINGEHMVQLTSDKQRPDAIRFYQGLGFVASHEGMKLKL
jgi:hypothetical protein